MKTRVNVMRKIFALLLFLIIIVSIGIIYYGQFEKSNANTLTEDKMIAKESDDFILHVQMNGVEEGIEVLHSIQYNGQKKVEIQHQSPLISVSFFEHDHDFTGSYVQKEMVIGDIYHPQKATVLSAPNRDTFNLYIQAKFEVDGEVQVINHVEELEFE